MRNLIAEGYWSFALEVNDFVVQSVLKASVAEVNVEELGRRLEWER